MIDIFQDRATVRQQKIAELKLNRKEHRTEAEQYRRQAENLDAKGWSNFYFIWGIDDNSEDPIREMERNYLEGLTLEKRQEFVASLDETRRAKIKADYRAAVAGERITEMSAEISRLQWISRKESVAKLIDRVLHWH
jgi:hypothetical protein